MLMIISPAKTLDLETPTSTQIHRQPRFLEQSQELINAARKLSAEDISSLMKISEKISLLNYERFHDWQTPFTLGNAKQAILTFRGDVYTGLDAVTLDEESLEWADNHLVMLSGLYGLLKPLDLMQAYRLEMGTKLINSKGVNLYEFWGDMLTEAVNEQLATFDTPVLVNLASHEYYKAMQPQSVTGRIITPVFKDEKNGTFKIISFYAKRARGLMARWVIDNRITEARELKEFNSDGYCFSKPDSTENELVFLRKEQAPK